MEETKESDDYTQEADSDDEGLEEGVSAEMQTPETTKYLKATEIQEKIEALKELKKNTKKTSAKKQKAEQKRREKEEGSKHKSKNKSKTK
ncbi:hypothetical protein FRX31_010913 [Thalictrum thalictroides]|uniref:Uncharacterized protein n=1 Tax=Thalictrum thalictroides TaxID=46969 RepID=A0A7J6WQ54_THATH|nr:hypothetical protein FRX31_010913 [Thalictrum thalictroides]